MAYSFSLNNPVNYGENAMLVAKDELVTLGAWDVLQSGDGNAIGPSSLADLNGDVLTTASPTNLTPNSIGNTECWMRIQSPNGREFLIQHAFSTGDGYNVRYSAAAGFVEEDNGSVSATVAPTAADEAFIAGTTISSGVDLWTGLAGTGVTGDERSVVHACAGGADEDYSFYVFSHRKGNLAFNGGIFMDMVTEAPGYIVDAVVVGTAASTDLGGWQSSFKTVQQVKTPSGTGHGGYSWVDAINSGPNQEMLACGQMLYGVGDGAKHLKYEGQTNSYPSYGVLNAASAWHGGYDDFGPVVWVTGFHLSTDVGRTGVIGKSRLFRHLSRGDLMRDITDDLEWRIIGENAIRWDGSTAPRVA